MSLSAQRSVSELSRGERVRVAVSLLAACQECWPRLSSQYRREFLERHAKSLGNGVLPIGFEEVPILRLPATVTAELAALEFTARHHPEWSDDAARAWYWARAVIGELASDDYRRLTAAVMAGNERAVAH